MARVRNIRPGMLKASWVEDNALRSAGLKDIDINRVPTKTVWHDEDFPIGPEKTMDILKEVYDE